MSAPLIWIVIPLFSGIILFFFQGKSKLVFTVSILLCVFLSLVALFQPIGGIIKFGSSSFEFKTTMIFLGRSFILENKDRFFLLFIYFAAAFWFFGSKQSQSPGKFIPLSMIVLSLLTAALAVEPFLYSAILIEVAVIVSLPLIVEKNLPIQKGVRHYFIYQSLAMPFILLSGWMLSGTQVNPSNEIQMQIAGLLLGLGFAFWLAVFPFHFWIPELAEESNTYTIGFLLSILSPIYLLIILKYVNGLVWLKDSAFLSPTLRVVGVLMIVTSGLLASTQTNLKKILGYLVIANNGFSLLCISLQSDIGQNLFYLSLIPHFIALGLFCYALALLQRNEISMDFVDLTGSMRKYPFTLIALLGAMLSIIGFPIFAGFSLSFELLEQFATFPKTLFWIFVGYALFTFTIFRLLIVIIGKTDSNWTIGESTWDILLLLPGLFILILMGIFPNIFLHGVWSFLAPLLSLT
jgi:NADH-quinone oxidoreductase subunit N